MTTERNLYMILVFFSYEMRIKMVTFLTFNFRNILKKKEILKIAIF